jgi:hypothetical protein
MEKKSSLLKSIIIGVCILVSGLIISFSIIASQPRYEIISHGSEIFIFDTKTGDYYSKFDATIEGPIDWTKVENPFTNPEE